MKDVVSIPLYLAMIALNCVEIFLIGKKPAKKRLKSEKMLLSLSIGDVMLGLNGVIGFFREIKVIPSSRFIILFLNSFIIFSVTFSILHILLLTLDRFVSVYYPIRRRILMSDHFINISLVVIWLFSLISVPFIVWHSVAKKSAIYPVFLSIEVLPTLVFLFFVYVMIYRRLRGSVTLATSNCRTSMASSVNLSSVSYVYDDARNHNENEAVTTGGLSQPGVAVECNVALSSNGNSDDLKVSSIKLEQQEQNGGKDKTMSSTEMTEILNSVSNPILYFFYRYWDKAKECCCCCC
eukprot:gene12001-13239_t